MFLKHQWRNGLRRCYRSRQFLHIWAGCHAVSVMQAHSGSIHGITMRVITKHAWRCPSHMCQRIPSRMIMNPNACACDILPATAPLALDTEPSLAPPPPPTPAAVTCPPSELATKGWELCSWQLSSPATVPKGSVDLAGIPDMDVCTSSLLYCWVFCRLSAYTRLATQQGHHQHLLLLQQFVVMYAPKLLGL